EQQSSHPIAKAIVATFKELNLDTVDQTEKVEEIAGSGIKKGDIQIGKPSVFDHFEDANHYLSKETSGNTTVFVGKGNDIVGYFSLADQVRKESAQAIAGFKQEGVHLALLTGDNERVAKKVAEEVGVDDYTAYCLPEDKMKFIYEDQAKDKVVGMIGDGINDAPALANADIGIAMGSGSSVAMESAEIVIVKNNLAKLFFSYQLSQKLNQIILVNISFSITVIVTLIILNLIGILNLPTAVLLHEGSTILVTLNGLRLLLHGKGNDN